MKTAISLSDDTYDRASRRAKELGLSRSEFFARAANNYLRELDARSEIEQINAALDQVAEEDEAAIAAVTAGHETLRGDNEEW